MNKTLVNLLRDKLSFLI